MKYFTLVNFSLEYDNFLGYAKYLVPTDGIGLPEYVYVVGYDEYLDPTDGLPEYDNV